LTSDYHTALACKERWCIGGLYRKASAAPSVGVSKTGIDQQIRARRSAVSCLGIKIAPSAAHFSKKKTPNVSAIDCSLLCH
jgi:hypothetical protein